MVYICMVKVGLVSLSLFTTLPYLPPISPLPIPIVFLTMPFSNLPFIIPPTFPPSLRLPPSPPPSAAVLLLSPFPAPRHALWVSESRWRHDTNTTYVWQLDSPLVMQVTTTSHARKDNNTCTHCSTLQCCQITVKVWEQHHSWTRKH